MTDDDNGKRAAHGDSTHDEYVFQYYQNTRERLTSQGDRLWNRFNYFLTIDTALVGAFFLRPENLGDGRRLYGLGALGILWSCVWFLVAAQDLWFYEDRYDRLKHFEDRLIRPKVGFTHSAGWHTRLPWWKKLFCFKIPNVGSTTFSAICPALFVMLWVAILAVKRFAP